MPNTINLRLLDNKNIIAERNNIPLAQENSYKIIAGEENATIFKIASKPEIYKNATFTITCTNSQGYNVPIELQYDEELNEYFYLPKGMAVAGYGYINISCTYNNGTKEEKVVWQSLKVKVWNTYESWKDYVPEGGNVDLTEYQKKTDKGLQTTDKTIVGAINELNEKVGQGGSNIEVDNELNAESENPVQNKVVTQGIVENIANTIVVEQDLSATDFTPVKNTYYRHKGANSTTYIRGTVYFYNGTEFKEVVAIAKYAHQTTDGHYKPVPGIVSYSSTFGTTAFTNSSWPCTLAIVGATEAIIDKQTDIYRPITVAKLSYAVKVGVTANNLTLTPEEQAKAQAWLGVKDYRHTLTFESGSKLILIMSTPTPLEPISVTDEKGTRTYAKISFADFQKYIKKAFAYTDDYGVPRLNYGISIEVSNGQANHDVPLAEEAIMWAWHGIDDTFYGQTSIDTSHFIVDTVTEE